MADQSPNNPNKKKDQVALAAFVDDMIKAKQQKHDVEILDNDIPKIKESLLKELNESINAHLLHLLSVDDQLALNDLLESNPSDAQLNLFFIQKIPNLQAEVATALLNFRNAYLFPVEEQIAQAVESIEPASETSQKEKKPVGEKLLSEQFLEDFPLPPAPPAPADLLLKKDSIPEKKWN
jgi:hypothetical protein